MYPCNDPATLSTTEESCFDSRQGEKFLLFFESFRTVLGPSTPPMERVAGALYPDFTHGCSTELKNKFSYTSKPAYTILAIRVVEEKIKILECM